MMIGSIINAVKRMPVFNNSNRHRFFLRYIIQFLAIQTDVRRLKVRIIVFIFLYCKIRIRNQDILHSHVKSVQEFFVSRLSDDIIGLGFKRCHDPEFVIQVKVIPHKKVYIPVLQIVVEILLLFHLCAGIVL